MSPAAEAHLGALAEKFAIDGRHADALEVLRDMWRAGSSCGIMFSGHLTRSRAEYYRERVRVAEMAVWRACEDQDSELFLAALDALDYAESRIPANMRMLSTIWEKISLLRPSWAE